MYWWNGADNKNFGDVLGPRLLEHFTNKEPVWTSAADSKLVMIGSIAEHLPQKYTGTVAGIGFANRKNKRKIDLSNAKVLGLRGELSFKASGLRDRPVLGDPGLVASDLLNESVKPIHEIGVIGHFKHTNIRVPIDAVKIDITWPIDEVILATSRCKSIITSSLHGLILADSLGIPRKWVTFNGIQADGNKFYDYFTSINDKALPTEWKQPNRDTIEKKKDELREMLSCL